MSEFFLGGCFMFASRNIPIIGLLTIVLCVYIALPAAADIKIGAIFAKSGPASFLGLPEDKSAIMLIEHINSKGGINGEKLILISKDSGGSPDNALKLAKELIEQDKVIAIIGPSTTGESLKIKDYCNENKTILISCAAAEEIVNPVLKYVFKTPQKDVDAAIRIYDAMKKKNIKKIAVLSSNSAFGVNGAAQLKKLAAEYGITIVVAETYDAKSTDLTEALNKIKDAAVQAIVNWSIEPAQGLIAKQMKQLGINAKLYQSHGFGNIKYVKMSGEAADNIIFPCGRLLIPEKLSDKNPQKAVLLDYKKNYEARFKEEASAFGGYAYDAAQLLIKAIEKSDANSEKIHDTIENTKNLTGMSGIFNMSAKDHNGLAKDSFEMITVKNGAFEIFK